MNKILSLIASLALLGAAAPAGASAASYAGKTKSGSSISFTHTGGKVSGVKSAVPVACAETGGSYDTRAGLELFRPAGTFGVRGGQSKGKQHAAVMNRADTTMTYKVALRGVGSKKVTGELKLSYLSFTYDYWNNTVVPVVCAGSTKFAAAKAR